MEKKIQITVPEGYTIDREKSTFECIILKRNTVKTWEDYKKEKKCCDVKINCFPFEFDDKFLKHMEAEFKIKLLMPYYGGEITDKEWQDANKLIKYTIERNTTVVIRDSAYACYGFLAFHTEQQRDDFLKHNERLVKDYFMLDN